MQVGLALKDLLLNLVASDQVFIKETLMLLNMEVHLLEEHHQAMQILQEATLQTLLHQVQGLHDLQGLQVMYVDLGLQVNLQLDRVAQDHPLEVQDHQALLEVLVLHLVEVAALGLPQEVVVGHQVDPALHLLDRVQEVLHLGQAQEVVLQKEVVIKILPN